ncbi:MAG: histidine kinase, partial [Alkalibacterium sp.]
EEWLSLIRFIFLFTFITYICTALKDTRDKELTYEKSFKQLSDDYAKMKRQMVTQEHVARQEERSHIARDIHDSVGHRLTALLMQLEVARHSAEDSETKQYFGDLKALAQDSLHDTRTAVKALRSDETAGIQAIVQLIRKLESESHLEIRFVIQSGVLGVKLTNAQSVTVYRSIQEALTNMMRHSKTRKATIEFSLLGDRYLQFKVCHAIRQKVSIKEGFGLSSMRNRLEELSGGLTLTQDENELRVIGQFPLQNEELRGRG